MRIQWFQDVVDKLRGKSDIKGEGNVVEFDWKETKKFAKVKIFGSNNEVRIKSTEPFVAQINIGSKDCPVNNCRFFADKKSGSNGANIVLMEDNSSVIIGQDTIISSGVNILCSDTHSILNLNDEVINIGKSIEIGNHCWIGMDSKILKNTKISDNSIVAAGAVVASNKTALPEGCILAGNPARVVKENINWDRKRPKQYLNENKVKKDDK